MSGTIALVAAPDAALRKVILDGLVAYNRTVLAPGLAIEDLAVAIHDESGQVVGGLWGRTGWGWLTIELIFVPEAMRGQGLASRLIRTAEEEALRRGCHAAWLDTLNPQALALYERLGYMKFGELNDFPRGGSRHFLQKALASVDQALCPQSSESIAQRS